MYTARIAYLSLRSHDCVEDFEMKAKFFGSITLVMLLTQEMCVASQTTSNSV